MMWKDENCLLTIFLQGGLFDEIPQEEGIVSVSESIPERSIPEYFKSISPEDIASEYMEFIRREFPESTIRPYRTFDLFLESKGLYGTYGIPLEINLKVTKARMLVEQEHAKLMNEEQQVRIEREKLELPILIDRFIDWLKDKELNKVRLVDVKRFVTENNLDLLSGTIQDIYNISQSKLDDEYRQKFLKEKNEIPSLVDLCVDWARVNGLKNVSKSDVETFLLEKEYDLTKESQRSVYSLTNTKLKSKK